MGSTQVRIHTVLGLDLSDIRKEHAQKMENLANIRDGRGGQGFHQRER